jgi:hypothetical protein
MSNNYEIVERLIINDSNCQTKLNEKTSEKDDDN